MAAVVDQEEFFSILVRSQLFDESAIAALRDDPELPTEPGACSERMIQLGLMTRFQAKQLLQGKHRGFILGPYRLLDQIGKGGMGTVYLGEHATLKRRVAVKVLARELCSDTMAVERFLRECRTASSLSHQNIMRVHHAGTSAGAHYMVMEYVDGATLEQVVDRKGPFTIEEAAKIAVQAASGLHHAHEKGFVHRDIKPENLMLTKDGTIKVLDMGLTKSVTRPEDNLTGILNSKMILGTIDYLSPEQAIQTDVDRRSDIYSLGATLFTLLTGHSPYEGVPAQQKLMQHQFGKVPILRDFRSDVPAELSAVIEKMMAKKPDDRFQTAQEIVRALEPWAIVDGIEDVGVHFPSRMLSATAVTPRTQSMTPTVRDSSPSTLTTQTPARVPLVDRDSESAPLEVRTPAPKRTLQRTEITRKSVSEKQSPWKLIAILTIVVSVFAVIAVVVIALK